MAARPRVELGRLADQCVLACATMPRLASHFSTSDGQSVTGNALRRRRKAWPPSAQWCISTATPSFFIARK
ncbi:MAG: hypothetical protein ABIP44_06915 [Pseudoxanthomonas sp.]